MTEYYRLNVYDYIDAFCGWDPLSEMIKYAVNERNQAYVTFLFKRGGRASEALMLETNNFSVKMPILVVSNMPLLKWFKKNGQDAKTGKRATQRGNPVRKPFPIPLAEPLTDLMLGYLANREGFLF